ncbi:MAG: DUF1273 domain-containing protein [Clostridia bacterium]|nr:DUF1273 domain-containing protein [Clostridia bacterium]
MDYSVVINSVGVVGQSSMIPTRNRIAFSHAISRGIDRLLENGYRRFLIAVTGHATLVFAETLLSMGTRYPDIFVSMLFPYMGWDKQFKNSLRYLRCMAQAKSVLYACDEACDGCVDITNLQLQDFGKCAVVIHDGADKTMQAFMANRRNTEQVMFEILV